MQRRPLVYRRRRQLRLRAVEKASLSSISKAGDFGALDGYAEGPPRRLRVGVKLRIRRPSSNLRIGVNSWPGWPRARLAAPRALRLSCRGSCFGLQAQPAFQVRLQSEQVVLGACTRVSACGLPADEKHGVRTSRNMPELLMRIKYSGLSICNNARLRT